MEMNFSRPGGTCADAGDDPALKRRAIFMSSRWDALRTKFAIHNSPFAIS
jgi:hypothetical protein